MIKATKQTRHSGSQTCRPEQRSLTHPRHSGLRGRHSEFISESTLSANKILKRVQDDIRSQGDNKGRGGVQIQGSTTQRGFTIVETLFVLAIGGLILIMTFLALGQTNRSKRDAQRKTDFAKINQNIASWTNEHHGILPTGTAAVQTASAPIPDSPDGSGNPYDVTATSITTACGAGSTNNIYYERTNDRSYKIKICLESGEFIENH